jgi:hypothetical protein
MNKTFAVILALTVSLALHAQTGKTGAVNAEAQASKIIEYTNAVIDLNNEQAKHFKEYGRVLEAADRCLERVSSDKYDPRFGAPFSTQTTYPVQIGYFTQYEAAEKKAPAFTEKAEIIRLVAIARESVKKLEDSSAKLGKYFTDNEFAKDEKFSLYPTLKENFISSLRDSRKAWHNAVSKASDAGDASEIIILKKSKISQFIIPMKTNLKLLDNVYSELFDLFEEEAINESLSTFNDHLAKLNASVEKDKSVANKNMALINHEDDYTNFFRHVENCSKYMSVVATELAKEEPDEDKIDSNIRMVNQEYNDTIRAYNYFAENGAK